MTAHASRRSLFLVLGFFVPALLFAFAPSAAYACTGVVEAAPSGAGGTIPPEGPAAGAALTVTGSGFAVGPVVLRWGSSDGPRLGETVTDSAGAFSLEVVVPETAGERPRIVAVSTEPGASGLPSMGWVDLASAEPATATTADAAPVEQPADQRGPAEVLLGGIAVVLVGVALAAAAAVRRRRRAADLDRELAQVLEADSALRVEDSARG